MSSVHHIAESGFATGTNELYHKVRPSYIPAVLNYIRDAVRSKPPFNIVEIGSGTGIFTQALLAHPSWSSDIGQLKAIEPSPGMRTEFSKHVTDKRVTIHEGTFDRTGIDDGWADMIVVAQAFHWCPDYDRASAEFARILKPTGNVTLAWNLEDRSRARWVAQLRDRIERHEEGSPQFRLMLWKKVYGTPSYLKFFSEPVEKIWPVIFPATADVVVNRACSKSYIAVLEENTKSKVANDIQEIVARGEDQVWIDKGAGIFEYPYQTWVVLAYKV